MKSKIQPVTFWQDSANQFEIELVQVKSLGEEGKATVVWLLKNNDGTVLKNGATVLEGSDYAQWGSDDNYILSKTAELLGLTLIVEAE